MVDGYKTTYFPGKHVSAGASPFLDSYPLHTIALTYVGVQRIIQGRAAPGGVREAINSLMLGCGPGMICTRCGMSWWDIVVAETLEPVFGAVCVARPQVVQKECSAPGVPLYVGDGTTPASLTQEQKQQISDSSRPHIDNALREGNMLTITPSGGLRFFDFEAGAPIRG